MLVLVQGVVDDAHLLVLEAQGPGGPGQRAEESSDGDGPKRHDEGPTRIRNDERTSIVPGSHPSHALVAPSVPRRGAPQLSATLTSLLTPFCSMVTP